MKLIIKLLAGAVALVVVLIAAIGLLLDPNDYKGEIETLARDKAAIELKIGGDIGWSLFPTLGLELEKVEANSLEGAPLASLNKAQVSVKLLALLSGEVVMDGVLVDGLELAIVAPKAGEKSAAPKESEAADDNGAPSQSPKLDIGNVDIRNANISYEDPASGQKFVLSDFNFSGENVSTGRAFPAAMAFDLAIHSQPGVEPMQLQTELKTQLYLDLEQSLFRADALALQLNIQGPAFGQQTVPVSVNADLLADLKADRAEVKGLLLKLASLAVKADLNVAQLQAKPLVTGSLDIPAFDVNDVLAALGQAAVATSDPEVLKQVALSAKLAGPANVISLKDLKIQLDNTNFGGEIRYDLANSAQQIQLQGDRLELDRYLPPKNEQAAEAPDESKGERYPKTPLFPVETLRGLKLNAELGLGELLASGVTVSNIKFQMAANSGLIKVKQVSGQLYEGQFNNNAILDARKEPLTLTVNKQVSQVQLGGLVKDLTQQDHFSGAFNMTGNYRTTGNSVHAIVHSLDGKLDFSLKDGRIKGVNLVDKLCSGILQLQGKQPTSTAVADYTEFSNLSGTVNMNDGVLDNRNLKAALVGVNLGGNGQVNLPAEALDYGLSLTVLQELKGPNCQLDDKLHNLSLPLRCKGGFDDAPTDMCGIDSEGMKQVLADLGAAEVKAKAKAKVEAKKEEVKEKLESKIGDKLKGLFN